MRNVKFECSIGGRQRSPLGRCSGRAAVTARNAWVQARRHYKHPVHILQISGRRSLFELPGKPRGWMPVPCRDRIAAGNGCPLAFGVRRARRRTVPVVRIFSILPVLLADTALVGTRIDAGPREPSSLQRKHLSTAPSLTKPDPGGRARLRETLGRADQNTLQGPPADEPGSARQSAANKETRDMKRLLLVATLATLLGTSSGCCLFDRLFGHGGCAACCGKCGPYPNGGCPPYDPGCGPTSGPNCGPGCAQGCGPGDGSPGCARSAGGARRTHRPLPARRPARSLIPTTRRAARATIWQAAHAASGRRIVHTLLL